MKFFNGAVIFAICVWLFYFNFDVIISITHPIQSLGIFSTAIGKLNLPTSSTYLIPVQIITVSNLSKTFRSNRRKITNLREINERMHRICENQRFEKILEPCKNKLKWSQRATKKWKRTDIYLSVFHLELHPCGSASSLIIETFDFKGMRKRHGGDYWRVHVRQGTRYSAAVAMRDIGDGSYEGFFTFDDPGEYMMSCVLEYSECDGLRDPPPGWFTQGKVLADKCHYFIICMY